MFILDAAFGKVTQMIYLVAACQDEQSLEVELLRGCGTNRSAWGAQAFANLKSVIRTC